MISADSHPISSGFVFTVGEGAAPAETVDELLAGSKAGSVTWNALSVARGVQYAAIAVGLGAVIFLLLAWLPALTEAAGPSETWRTASQAFATRLRKLLGVAALAGALSAAAAVVLQGAVASASSFWSALSPDTVREILETRFGTVWGLGAVAWVIVGGLVITRVAAVPQLRPASVGATGLAPRVPRWGALALVPLAFLAAVPALGGHASVQDPRWLLLPANVLHVIAMAAWLGGIAVLVLALRSATAALEGADRTRLLAATVARFSVVAGVAIAVVLATGVTQSIVHLESLGDLIDTAFGRAILVKSSLFFVIVGFGWINRSRMLPRLRGAAAEGDSPGRAGVLLRRTLRVELALGAAVIVATAALASYAPPTSLGGGPFSTDFTLGPARAEVTIDPARVGTNDMHLYLFRSDTGAQYDATKELRISGGAPGQGHRTDRIRCAQGGAGPLRRAGRRVRRRRGVGGRGVEPRERIRPIRGQLPGGYRMKRLPPLGAWDFISRGRFETHHDGHLWTVDLSYFDFDEKLHLYRDGVEADVQKSPASFHLNGGTIEASMSLLGMRRVDLVVDDETTVLTPVGGTAEAWRLQLERDRPELSRLIGAVSWTVLVAALIYEVPHCSPWPATRWAPTSTPRSCCQGSPTSCSASPRSPQPWSEHSASRAIAGSASPTRWRPRGPAERDVLRQTLRGRGRPRTGLGFEHEPVDEPGGVNANCDGVAPERSQQRAKRPAVLVTFSRLSVEALEVDIYAVAL